MHTIKLKTLKTLFGFCIQMLIYQNIIAQNWASNFHYFQHTQTYNAAYAGIKTVPSFNINYHHLNKNTNLLGAGFHTQLNKKPIGLGLSFKRDKYNTRTLSNFEGQFAYHFQLQQNIKLSAGMQLGLQHIYLDLATLVFDGDPEVINDYFLNVSLAFILYSKKYYVGISLNNLINKRLNKQGFLDDGTYNTLYLSGGIIFNEHSNFAIRTSALLNINFESIIEYWRYTGFVEISVDALLYKTLWLGATLKPNQPLKVQAKVDLMQQISLLGYCQFIKRNFSFEKNYFFGFGLQALLTKTGKDVSHRSPYF